MSAKLSGPRVFGFIAITTTVFCALWAGVFVLMLMLTFAPDPHVFFTPWDRFVAVAIPTAVAAVAMAVTTALVDRWTFGPTQERRSTRGRRWAIRLLSPFVIILATVTYREIGFRRTVAAARTSAQSDLFEATASLAVSDRGRRALLDIVGDRRLAAENRAEAATALERPDGPPLSDVDALVRELLNDPDPTVRARAASIVTWIPPQRGSPFTRSLLDDRDDAVVLNALDILERSFLDVDEGVIERVGRLMLSDNPAVRAKAKREYMSQVRLGTEGSRRNARSLVDAPDREVRMIAASKLANAGDLSGENAALAVLSENQRGAATPGFDVVSAAMYVLTQSQDEQVAPVLWTLARCPSVSKENRDYARVALNRWFTDRAPAGQAVVVPDDYRDADAVYAPSRPAWRAEYCQP